MGLLKFVPLAVLGLAVYVRLFCLDDLKTYAAGIYRGVSEKELVFNDANCFAHSTESMHGSEDFANVDDSLTFISSGDLHKTLYDIANASPGGIYAFRPSADPAPAERVPIRNFPAGRLLQPHGIFYSDRSERLYVVNHLGEPLDAVEVFKVVREPLQLEFLFSVSSEHLPNGVANDLVEGATENEFYVTRWLYVPLPIAGRDHATLAEKIPLEIGMFLPMVMRRGVVYRCFWEGQGQNSQCEVAGDGFGAGNGIAISDDRKTVFVVDYMRSEIHEMAREASGALTRRRIIPTPYLIDNVDFDGKNNRLLLGGIPNMMPALKASKGEKVSVPGTILEVDLSQEPPVSRDLVVHDGLKLSQISAGTRSGQWYLLGSPFSMGYLVCPVQ